MKSLVWHKSIYEFG